MNKTERDWERLAAELDEGLRHDLGGPLRARKRGAIRTRGAPVEKIQPSGKPWSPAPVVVVEAAEDMPSPTEEEVRKKLNLREALDLYYVVRGKHWAALESRELNPDDRENTDHHLLLRNLRPDHVIVPAGRGRPSWCAPETRVTEW